MLDNRPIYRVLAASIAALLSTTAAQSAPKKAQDQPRVRAVQKGSQKSGKNNNTVQTQEQKERQVDRAALQAQLIAEKKLSKMIKKYRGSAREGVLLFKLGEVYVQSATIEFRLAYADSASQKGKKSAFRKYNSKLKQAIRTFTTLINKYPKFGNISRAYYQRGKAHEELEQKVSAKRDYLTLTRRFPNAPENISAYMSLARFAVDENQYKKAVQYLHEVEKAPESAYYPFAIYKLAWSYYNLQEIPKALGYLKQHIRLYQAKYEVQDEFLISSDIAILENSVMDSALFYLEGFELGKSEYSLSNAHSFFSDIKHEPAFGRLIAKFARLLKAHGHDQALIQWKDEMLKKELNRPETMGIVITAFEYFNQRNNYEKMSEVSKDIVRVYHANSATLSKLPVYAEVQKLLLNTAKDLRRLTIKNKRATRVSRLSKTLAAVYDTFIRVVSPRDPRVAGVHYNLAETLFEIGQYDQATTHYRWIVKNWQRKNKAPVKLSEASLKAISSRYEAFRSKKMFPKKLAAVPMHKNSERELSDQLAAWIKWIDWHDEEFGKKSGKTFENFQFEGNRLLYSKKKLKLAVKRLEEFAIAKPASKFAIPSASLVLDTYVISSDWEAAHLQSNRFLGVKRWKHKPFSKRVFKLASDSYYKMMEKENREGNTEKTLDMADEFLAKYQKSERLEDVLLLAGNAALKAKDSPNAEKFYGKLIQKFPKSENTAPALLSRAQIAEQRYDFHTAAADYRAYLGLPASRKKGKERHVKDLRKKLLAQNWLSGNWEKLRADLKEKQMCTELAALCDRYRALLATRGMDSSNAFKRALNAPKDNRPIWATAALERQDKMAFPDRLLMIRVISARLKDMDAQDQLAVLPLLSRSMPKAFENNRQRLRRYASLKANQRSIQRRVKLMREMEESAAKAMKVPWASIRASILNEIASSYIDFSNELSNLPIPKGLAGQELQAYNDTIQELILPFEEKGHEVRSKAFELASKFSVRDEVINKISQSYFRDNPSQAKALQGEVRFRSATDLGHKNVLVLIQELDPEGDWPKGSIREIKKDKPKFTDEPTMFLKVSWYEAVANRRPEQAAYFLSELKGKEGVSDESLTLMKAFTLTSAGGQAEGLLVLDDHVGDFNKKIQSRIRMIQLTHALASLSKESAAKFVEELQSLHPGTRISYAANSRTEAFALAYSAVWSEIELEPDSLAGLLKEAQASDTHEQRKWAAKVFRRVQKARKLAKK